MNNGTPDQLTAAITEMSGVVKSNKVNTITQTIGRDARPKQKLNPPKFEEELIDFRNPKVFWGMALEKVSFGMFKV